MHAIESRYSRQVRFAPLGEEGQQRIRAARVAIVGCGALGSLQAEALARAGVGTLRLIDRDFVEWSNLQRQFLFDEADAAEGLPKAVAAARRLARVNSEVAIEPMVADLTPSNAAEMLEDIGLILDGTDNFETRLLVNDAAISSGTPWIYGAAVGSYGVTMAILPGRTACLACLLEAGDEAGMVNADATCDTSGILNSAASLVASLQATEAIKLLAGKPEALHGRLLSCDVWTGKFQSIRVARNPECRACARREFTYLQGEAQPQITMCGRNSVQIHERRRALDLSALSGRLSGTATEVQHNDFLLRFRAPPYELTVFADGRAIIKGTRDPAVARSLYARFIGA
jgi:molybdopterin-synthase adenylyltransferase